MLLGFPPSRPSLGRHLRARSFTAITLATAALLVATPPAAASDLVLVSDNRTVTLTDGEGGTATAVINLVNSGAGTPTVEVEPTPGAGSGCTITPTPSTLEPYQQQAVTLTFARACDPDAGIGFTITATDGQSFSMQADPPTTPSPDWGAVAWSYGITAGVAFLLLMFAYATWAAPARRHTNKSPRMPLPGLGASWKFTDSWAANATVLTALFAGVFGTKEAAELVLGESGAVDVLSVALVSAAVSVGLAALSPMVLQMLRERVEEMDSFEGGDERLPTGPLPADLYVTPTALIAAATVTLAATGGQLASILVALIATDFANDLLLILVGVLVAVLLACYAVVSTQQNLTTGATAASPEEQEPKEPSAVTRFRTAAAKTLTVRLNDMTMDSTEVDEILAERPPRRSRPPSTPKSRPSGIL